MYNVSIKMSFMTLYICEHTIWISFTTEYLAISLCQMRRTHFWTQMNVSLYFPINVHRKIIHQDIRYQSWSDRIWCARLHSFYFFPILALLYLLPLFAVSSSQRERERERQTETQGENAEVSLETHLVPCLCPRHRKFRRWLAPLHRRRATQEGEEEGNEVTSPVLEAQAAHPPSVQIALLGCQEGGRQQEEGWESSWAWGERRRGYVRVREQLRAALLLQGHRRRLPGPIVPAQPAADLPNRQRRTPSPGLSREDRPKASVRVRDWPSAGRPRATAAAICDDAVKKCQDGGDAIDGLAAPPVEVAGAQEEGRPCFQKGVSARQQAWWAWRCTRNRRWLLRQRRWRCVLEEGCEGTSLQAGAGRRRSILNGRRGRVTCGSSASIDDIHPSHITPT